MGFVRIDYDKGCIQLWKELIIKGKIGCVLVSDAWVFVVDDSTNIFKVWINKNEKSLGRDPNFICHGSDDVLDKINDYT